MNRKALTVLYALMLLAALVLTLFGARLYSALTAQRAENDHRRSTLSYAQSKIQAADAAGGVAIAQGPEGDLLILREGDSGYETRIYLYAGALREELSPSGSELRTDAAQSICSAGSFSAVLLEDGLLSVTADGVSALIDLHSEGGAADGP